MTAASLLLAILLAAPAQEQAQSAPLDSTPPVKAARAVKPPSSVTTADTTFYITNRARKRGVLQREFADSLEFGVIVSKVITGTSRAPLDQLIGRVTIRAADSAQLSREEFRQRLHVADSATGETVMYVHGYATSFARGMIQTTEIAHRGSHSGAYVLFSWPAHRAIATWPTFGALISRAYRDDSVSAHKSAGALLEALDVIRGATPSKAVTLVGHSMGAQLVAEALRSDSVARETLTAAPLRAIVFFAPDIAATRFRDSLAAPLAPLAARRVVYVSSHDKMLALSRLLHRAPRAGQTSGGLLLASADVEVVDVSGGRRAVSGVRRIVDTFHAMRYSGTALYDFFGVAAGNRADCRPTEGLMSRAGERLWTLTNAELPAAAPACPLVATATPPVPETSPAASIVPPGGTTPD